MSKLPITFTQVSPSSYQVVFENGVTLGILIKEVDGYYVFYPDENGGYWEACGLRIISDKLNELNKDWDEEIRKHFNE